MYQYPHLINPTQLTVKKFEEIDGLTFLRRHCSPEQFQQCIDIIDSLFPPLCMPPNGGDDDNEDRPPPVKRRRKRKRKRRSSNIAVKSGKQIH